MISKADLKDIRSLKQKKQRKKRELFLAEGFRIVREAIASELPVLRVLFTKEFSESVGHRGIVKELGRKRIQYEEVSSREFRSIADTDTSQGILAVVRQRQRPLEEFMREPEEYQLVVGLDAVSDPGNLGTMLRTCDWFGVDMLLLGKGTVDAFNPKVVRSSMGAVFHVPLVEDVDLDSALRELQNRSFSIVATDMSGKVLDHASSLPRKTAVIFGNEAWGVRPSLMAIADHRIRIRGFGRAESLNVSVACGVILSMLRRS